MIPDAQKLVVMDVTRSLARSWWTIVAGLCIGLAVAIVAFRHAPLVFQAQTNILADAERLPKEFIRPTISSDEGIELKLQELREAVLTEENLAALVEEVYPRADSQGRGQYFSSLIAGRTGIRYFPRTKTIQLTYIDSNPRRAATIIDRVADLLVEGNVQLRSKDAALLTGSLEMLALQTKTELDSLKQELDDIRKRHPFETEVQRLSNERMLAKIDEDLEVNRVALMQAEQRVQQLDAQRSFADSRKSDPTPGSTIIEENDPISADARVLELQEEIDDLLHRYEPGHPTVRAKQRELQDLLEDEREGSTDPSRGAESNKIETATETLDIWGTQLRAAQLETKRLKQNSVDLNQKMNRYSTYLANTPMIQRQIDDLVSRIEIKRREQLEHETKIAQSRLGERIEEEELGNPFVKLYDAVPPSQPISPDPMRFLTIGIVAGLAAFVGPLLARTFLKPLVNSELSLRALSEVQVLVSIPMIVTPQTKRERRRRWIGNIGLAAGASVVLAAVVFLDKLGMI